MHKVRKVHDYFNIKLVLTVLTTLKKKTSFAYEIRQIKFNFSVNIPSTPHFIFADLATGSAHRVLYYHQPHAAKYLAVAYQFAYPPSYFGSSPTAPSFPGVILY